MRISLLFSCFLAGFAAVSAVYEDETVQAIETGRDRFQKIQASAQQTDTTVTCDFENFRQVVYNTKAGPSQAIEMIEKLNLPLQSQWTRIDISFPKDREPDDFSTKHFNYYNPDGAILYADIATDNRRQNEPAYSSADVSWTLLKQVMDTKQSVEPGNGDYSNLRYLMFHPVTTDGIDQVFDDFVVEFDVQTFTENDENLDGFFAFLGLDIGAPVSGLLQFHNQQMGGKRIHSVRAWTDNEGQPAVMWELE